MIDRHWQVQDLNARTWRNLNRFIDVSLFVRAAQPDEHGLFVLHDGAQVLRVVDSQSAGPCDLPELDVSEPRILAQHLFDQGRWERVHVIDKRHLAAVERQSQQPELRALSIDQYYQRVFHLLWDDPQGYVCLPPHPGHWNHFTLNGVRAFVQQQPDPCSLTLGVIGADGVEIGLIADLGHGAITTLTTFETFGLPQPEIALTPQGLDQLWELLSARDVPPSVVVLCTPATFEAWLTAADKQALLQSAVAAGTALYRTADVAEPSTVPA